MNCRHMVLYDGLILAKTSAVFIWLWEIRGQSMQVFSFMTVLGLSVVFTGSFPANAQAQSHDSIFIPERFAKCSKVPLGESQETHQLNKCFGPTIERYYGRLYRPA